MFENISLNRYRTRFKRVCLDYNQKKLEPTVVILRLQKIEQALISHRQKYYGNKPELTKKFTDLINQVVAKRIKIQDN